MLSISRKSIPQMIIVLLLGTATAAWGAGREIQIIGTDSFEAFVFKPRKVVIRAGETLTLTFVNKSKLGLDHELMIGRQVVLGGVFGDQMVGFKTDFFDGIDVKFISGKGIRQFMGGKAKVTGIKLMKSTGEELQHGFMIEVKPKGTATISFTVPESRAGVWDMGCFNGDGTWTHYEKGARGLLVVLK